MFGHVYTSALSGIDGKIVSVEADFGDGLPCFEMVGFLGSEVKEAKERVRSALKNSDILIPPGRLTVNLSPADLRKQGNSFDLPIAIAILITQGLILQEDAEKIHFIGELSLDGKLRPVRGAVSHVLAAKENGILTSIVPKENVKEALVIPGLRVFGADSLSEVISILLSKEKVLPETDSRKEYPEEKFPLDFSEICGQEAVKRAAVVASGGMHGLLMIGPPGSGKTLTARRLPTILPPLTEKERLECTKIHSVAGLLNPEEGLVRQRPFRSPHHTVSTNGLVGGGTNPRPGEMTLAHNGVLFLDELPEFSKITLEVMRQPLEDRKITISRVNGTYVFPTKVMLVAAMNPCQCGYYPDRNKCHCNEAEVKKYLSKISKPLLDRMDIITEVPRVSISDMRRKTCGLTSKEMQESVIRAHAIQKKRYENSGISFNSEMNGAMLRRFCSLSDSSADILKTAFEKYNLSARAHDRILKVARTIADLAAHEEIAEEDLLEAISYRKAGEKFFGR